MTTKLLANQYQNILADPVEGFTVELADESSLYEWRVYIEGPKDTPYEGGVFQLSLSFPKDYPMSPPTLKFISDFWHPNVYNDGKVCMSILHPPGEDAMSGELAQERWLPTQSVTTIVLSLLSLLNDPNCSSPANVDASVEWRKNREGYISKCKRLVERANKEKPAHVVIPHPDTNEEEHKRIVQKWKEMNKDLGEEDFFEHHDEDEDEDEEEEEDEDEDELLESNSEMNEEDSEASDAKPKEKGKEKDKEKGKEKEKEPEIAVVATSAPSRPPSTSSNQISTSSSESISASSSNYPPENNKQITEEIINNNGNAKPKEIIIEESPASSSNASNPAPNTNIPVPNSNNPGPSSSNSNPNSNSEQASSPRGKRKGKGKGKGKRKCIIM